jgi:uncharacterized protein YutE (UPF0331/DUF86 family)
MDWKQFIVSLIESLSWPIFILIIFYLFKSEIGKLIQKLAHLKYKDLELEFEKVKQQSQAIHEEIQGEGQLPQEKEPIFLSLENQIFQTLEKSPAAAILLAWSIVEAALASAVSRMAISPEDPSYRSPLHNIEMLEKYGGLPKRFVTVLNELRVLRNKIAHQHDVMTCVSQEQATPYARAAIDLIQYLNRIERGANQANTADS